MQKNWSNSPCIMKKLKLFLLISFFPFIGFAQSLNGVYTGVLSNDSSTARRDQSFEMALTEYNGKVYGYAYSTFIVNDTLYYIVKRVKGKVEGDICEVEDDEVISHNFPQKPEKKVFVSYTLRRNVSDSVWKLDGNWKTNLTKKYYAISGKVETKEEKDLSKSKLYEHLGDLDLQNTVSVSKPKEKEPQKKPVKTNKKDDVAKNTVKKDEKKDIQNTETKTVNNKPDASVAKVDTKVPDNKSSSTATAPLPAQTGKKDVAAVNTNTVDKKPDASSTKIETRGPDNKIASTPANNQATQTEKKLEPTNTSPVDKNPVSGVAKTEAKVSDNKTVSTPVQNQSTPVKRDAIAPNTTAVKTDPKQSDSKLVSVPVGYQPTQNANKTTAITTVTTVEKKPENTIAKTETRPVDNKTISSVTDQPTQNVKRGVAATEEKASGEFEFRELRRDRKLKPAATLVDGRVSIPSETIYFTSDSLSIALYDNGEVDGDTVSVIINDEMFIQKQGLKSSAFRKTFYVPRNESDSLLVVLYAENLGKYPPNTGLLQIKDGEEIFYVRFKADLDRNAAIVLRRKSK